MRNLNLCPTEHFHHKPEGKGKTKMNNLPQGLNQTIPRCGKELNVNNIVRKHPE